MNWSIFGLSGAIIVAVIGWIIIKVNSNSDALLKHEQRISILETNINWIKDAIIRMEKKLNGVLDKK